MNADLLHDAVWTCASSEPDAISGPGDGFDALDWLPVEVPGTAAGALRAAGRSTDGLDDHDWWFRTTFEAQTSGSFVLTFEGIATLSEIWVNGLRVAASDSMFRRIVATVDINVGTNELAIRCRALSPVLAEKQPRPRWRTRLVQPQTLRWIRTSHLGRMPGWAGTASPVGPWRPVTLTSKNQTRVLARNLRTWVEGSDGIVSLVVTLSHDGPLNDAVVRVGEVEQSATLSRNDGDTELQVQLRVPSVQLWWPHTHGEQPLYDVSIELDGERIAVGRVGFRTVDVDRTNDNFAIAINGTPIFCRGGCWVPPDLIALSSTSDELRAALEAVRDAGMNMVRVTGTSVYEQAEFWDLCDELGLMVWQDAMLSTLDPPDTAEFLAELDLEIREVLTGLQGRPSLTVFSGGSETEQQATMFGLSADRRHVEAFETTMPQALRDVLPGIPFVTSSPSGGALATHNGAGVAHYFGVGGYQRSLDDARRANVRFAAECLAFANPPEAIAVTDEFGSAHAAASDQTWLEGVPRDAGATWDFADVRNFYVREIFGVDPSALDADRALTYGRAAIAEAMSSTFAEWRRPGSSCNGGLVLTLRDLAPGSGWGLWDHRGNPKSPAFALRRAFAPRAVVVTDEGLDGLAIHTTNDGPEAFTGRIAVELYGLDGRVLETANGSIELGPHTSRTVMLDDVLDGFRDVTYAYRFGERTFDVAHIELLDENDAAISSTVHLLQGQARPVVDDLGLSALATPLNADAWELTVSTRDLAQWVSIEIPGFTPDDSWFHLAPGATHVIMLVGPSGQQPHGVVRALNQRDAVSIDISERSGDQR